MATLKVQIRNIHPSDMQYGTLNSINSFENKVLRSIAIYQQITRFFLFIFPIKTTTTQSAKEKKAAMPKDCIYRVPCGWHLLF